jgi:hypothetical protein
MAFVMDQVDARLANKSNRQTLDVFIKPVIGRIEIHVRNIVPIKLFPKFSDENVAFIDPGGRQPEDLAVPALVMKS